MQYVGIQTCTQFLLHQNADSAEFTLRTLNETEGLGDGGEKQLIC